MPLPALDSLVSLMKTRSIMAGVRLGVFEALAEGPLPPAAVAAARGLDPPSCLLLLRALAFAGYLEQEGDKFALSRLGRDTMLPGSPRDFRGYLRWNYTQWELVQGLGELVKTGRGPTSTIPSRIPRPGPTTSGRWRSLPAATRRGWRAWYRCGRARAACSTSPAATARLARRSAGAIPASLQW